MNPQLRRILASSILMAAMAAGSMLAAQSRASAQSGNATLRGTVSDATNAPIPGASILLILTDGQSLAAETDVSGIFTYSNLKPGKYHVQISSTGFQSVDEPAIALVAGENVRTFAMVVFRAKQEGTLEAAQP